MRFLIVRTEIRAAADDELAAAWAQGERLRDEQTSPEQRRQTLRADDRDAALLLARALSSVGAVRSGRQRVKVLPVGQPEPRPRTAPNTVHSIGGSSHPVDQISHPADMTGRPGDRNGHPVDLGPPPGSISPQPQSLGPQSRFT